MINILVTAVGSELAFSIIKALKLANFAFKLYGSDINSEVVGKYWCDKFFQVTLAKNETVYIQNLKDIVQAEGINAIIPTTRVIIGRLSKSQFENCVIFYS
jgi:hypothetical protein